MKNIAVSARQISASIANASILRGVDLDLPASRWTSVVGPNGAGKSTTIKMLTGILFPTSGAMKVLGFNPQRDRQQLAYHIGSVFGQKPQLWYHLPPIDTYQLFSRI